MRRALRVMAGAAVALALAGCGLSSITPAPASSLVVTSPPAPVRLSFAATGLVYCGIVPDWTCVYYVQVQGQDGMLHEGYFDWRPKSSPPSVPIVGDIPSQLAPGSYAITFLKQRVYDTVSSVPVPGGTPMMSNRGEVEQTCRITLGVSGDADITVRVAFDVGSTLASPFSDPRCSATVEITARS